MTRADKPVKRETYSRHRNRPIIVELGATWIAFRLKGNRTRFVVDVQGAMERAMYLAAEQARREKRKKGTRR